MDIGLRQRSKGACHKTLVAAEPSTVSSSCRERGEGFRHACNLDGAKYARLIDTAPKTLRVAMRSAVK